MKRFAMLFALLSAAFVAASAKADTVGFDSGQSLSGWTMERSYPYVFGITQFDGKSVLQLTTGGYVNQNTYYNWRSMAHVYPLSGDVQTYSVDQYAVTTSSSQAVNTGLWGTGYNDANVVSALPIVAFHQNAGTGIAGFYGYDYKRPGTWNFLTSGSANGWNNLAIVLIKGVGIDYLVNGVKYGSISDTSTANMGKLSFNSYQFVDRVAQTTYYDNLTTEAGPLTLAVPLPASVWGGLAILVALGVCRFWKSSKWRAA